MLSSQASVWGACLCVKVRVGLLEIKQAHDQKVFKLLKGLEIGPNRKAQLFSNFSTPQSKSWLSSVLPLLLLPLSSELGFVHTIFLFSFFRLSSKINSRSSRRCARLTIPNIQ